MKAPIAIVILVSFLITLVAGPIPTYVQADEFHLPAPGVMVHLSPPLDPPVLKGIKVDPDNPFRFDFVLDKGDSSLGQDELKQEAAQLIKYFLASLTIPENDLWVNLSPYEKDRIIPNSFGLTEMGRDLLAEDYMLKQITASLIYPEDEVGKKFWKRIYVEAAKRYGTTNIPVSTFNKVWIVPQKAVVFENAKAGTAYVIESKLKVMLEEDYLSLEKHEGIQSVRAQTKDTNQLGSQIVREIVIPELTTEVNENKNFVKLRQVYNSLILATWYKMKIKNSILAQVYADKNKIAGVNNNDPQEKEKIYKKYLRAFKLGVFNYIKEDVDPATQEIIPRKYFSGGVQLGLMPANGESSLAGTKIEIDTSPTDLPNETETGSLVDVKAGASVTGPTPEVRVPTSQDFGPLAPQQTTGPSSQISPLPQKTDKAINTLWDLVNTNLGSPVSVEAKPRFVMDSGVETAYASPGENTIGLSPDRLTRGQTWGEEIMHIIRFHMSPRNSRQMGPFIQGSVDEFFGRLGRDYAREVPGATSLHNEYFEHNLETIWSDPKNVIEELEYIFSLSSGTGDFFEKANNVIRAQSLLKQHLSPLIERLENISQKMSTGDTAGIKDEYLQIVDEANGLHDLIRKEMKGLQEENYLSQMDYVNGILQKLVRQLEAMSVAIEYNIKDGFDQRMAWIKEDSVDHIEHYMFEDRVVELARQVKDEHTEKWASQNWHFRGYVTAELFMKDNPDWKERMPELLKMSDQEVYDQFIKDQFDSHITEHVDNATENEVNSAMNTIEAPSPAHPPIVDQTKVTAYLDESKSDPVVTEIKQRILKNLSHISFDNFKTSLSRVVDRFNGSITEGQQDSYAVLWDYKSHSSRRWVYTLAEPFLKVKPSVATYFQKAAEPRTNALKKVADKGISHFVIMDDASYSGEQISRTINQVVGLYRQWGIDSPRFTVVIPFISKRAVQEIHAITDCKIELIYEHVMPQLGDVLNMEEIAKINQQRGPSHDFTGDRYTSIDGMTYFDHRVADSFSLNEDMRSFFNFSNFSKPYAMPDSGYYQMEETEFNAYFNPDHAMNTTEHKTEVGKKASDLGGIDLTPANMQLQTQNAGEGIKFHLDPVMLAQLQNAPGFTPIIINIQPMINLREFLGVPSG